MNTPDKKTCGKEAFFHPLDDVGGSKGTMFITLWILVLPSSGEFSRLSCRGGGRDVSRAVGVDVDGEVIEVVVAFVVVVVRMGMPV